MAEQQIRGASGLGQYESDQKFLGLMKEAIQRKQGGNKDIQQARDRWRTVQRDPMTFKDSEASLRYLSANDQQALRENRYATAGAHLKGLNEEEAYRGTRMSDTINSVTDSQNARMSDRQLVMQEAESRSLIGQRNASAASSWAAARAKAKEAERVNSYNDKELAGFSASMGGDIKDYEAMTNQEISDRKAEYNSDLVTQTVDNASEGKVLNAGLKSKAHFSELLEYKYTLGSSDEELKLILTDLGYQEDTHDDLISSLKDLITTQPTWQ